MSNIQDKNHPWNPGYAIPRYVLAEPQGRGVFVTKQLKRGTISQVPHGLHRGGFTVPNYAKRRFTKNPLVTNMLPRRTVDAFAPDVFQRPTAKGPQGPVERLIAMGSVLDGSSIGGSTLAGSSLSGSLDGSLDGFALGNRQDPIRAYGEQGAAWIMREAKKLPPGQRVSEVKKLLHAVNSNLPGEVERKAKLYMQKGRSPKAAFQRALAASLSNHQAAEFVRLGKTGHADTLNGLGAYADLDGFWSTVATPFKLVGKGASKVGSLTVRGVKKLGGLTCGVAKSPVGLIGGAVAGGVAGGPMGAQAGAAGVQVAAGMCPKGTVPIQPEPPGLFGAGGLPILPIALAGGALVLVLALK